MSRNQRIMLVIAALAVAVVAFVIASPGSDDEDGDQAAETTATQTQTEVETETEVETQTETTPPEPPQPSVTRIQIQGGEVVGGAPSIEAEQGEPVRIVVAADAPDEIHLHGYDLTREAAPGAPARFNFTADLEGVFEIESHTAADAGLDPLVARLLVNPS
jgi:FtsP/CotA-like multicopper oxidase with cupredoxin domain